MKETKEFVTLEDINRVNEMLGDKPKAKRVHLPITKQREIARLYKAREGSALEIAKMYGISDHYVYRILDKFGVERRYPKLALSVSIARRRALGYPTESLPVGPQVEMKLAPPAPKLVLAPVPVPAPAPVQLPPPPAAPKRKRTVKAKPKKSWARNLFDKVFNRK